MPTIVKGIHVLFTGANGTKTIGITLQSDMSKEECSRRGYQHQWDVNQTDLVINRKSYQPFLSLSDAAYDDLVSDMERFLERL